ncbi:type II toxin-antitoxin system RelE/ParE family toxin [Candidatus Pacearchaeota archaeon]|nr:type II toxin-antitoxin system RelE/ParE family toxin [Candidatus Pacearchaeota archaeon]
MHEIVLSQRAQSFLNKLDNLTRERIEKRLKNLENNPVPSGVKFIGRVNGEKLFRYRVGDYRALYLLNDKDRLILITKIDKRPRVYD